MKRAVLIMLVCGLAGFTKESAAIWRVSIVLAENNPELHFTRSALAGAYLCGYLSNDKEKNNSEDWKSFVNDINHGHPSKAQIDVAERCEIIDKILTPGWTASEK